MPKEPNWSKADVALGKYGPPESPEYRRLKPCITPGCTNEDLVENMRYMAMLDGYACEDCWRMGGDSTARLIEAIDNKAGEVLASLRFEIKRLEFEIVGMQARLDAWEKGAEDGDTDPCSGA